jgi:hypothetical protein
MRPTARTVLALGLLVAVSARAQGASNLLVNPGAETGTTSGWTVDNPTFGGTSNPGVDNGSFDPGINPHSGSFDFYGHTGPFGTLDQVVSLSGVVTNTQIDSGLVTAAVSFWEQSLNQGNPSDSAGVGVYFLNSSNTLISSETTPIVFSIGAWENVTETFTVPVGTRSIDYVMEFVRHVGSDNDSFIDDNSLVVTAGAAVPEPSGLVLGCVGALTVITFVCLRRISRAAAMTA